jgi:hypothetical protein
MRPLSAGSRTDGALASGHGKSPYIHTYTTNPSSTFGRRDWED